MIAKSRFSLTDKREQYHYSSFRDSHRDQENDISSVSSSIEEPYFHPSDYQQMRDLFEIIAADLNTTTTIGCSDYGTQYGNAFDGDISIDRRLGTYVWRLLKSPALCIPVEDLDIVKKNGDRRCLLNNLLNPLKQCEMPDYTIEWDERFVIFIKIVSTSDGNAQVEYNTKAYNYIVHTGVHCDLFQAYTYMMYYTY